MQGTNAWLTIGLREGKNREVKNILGALGLDVTRLIRVSYGPFQLGELPRARCRRSRAARCAISSATRLIEESGANFEADIAKPFSAKERRHPAPREPPRRAGGRRREEPLRVGEGGLIKKPKRRRDSRAKALQRLSTKRTVAWQAGAGDSRSGRTERVEPGRTRSSNVWMAPGARPPGEGSGRQGMPSPARQARPAPGRGPAVGRRKPNGPVGRSRTGRASGAPKPRGGKRRRARCGSSAVSCVAGAGLAGPHSSAPPPTARARPCSTSWPTAYADGLTAPASSTCSPAPARWVWRRCRAVRPSRLFVEERPEAAPSSAQYRSAWLAGRSKILRRDATRLGRNPPRQAVSTLSLPIRLTARASPSWRWRAPGPAAGLAERALVVVEESEAAAFAPAGGFALLQSRSYGDTVIDLLGRADSGLLCKRQLSRRDRRTGLPAAERAEISMADGVNTARRLGWAIALLTWPCRRPQLSRPPTTASPTSCSTTAWRSSSSPTTARRSSPTWCGTRSASADEPPGKSGIAHFFEHLMFKAQEPQGRRVRRQEVARDRRQ